MRYFVATISPKYPKNYDQCKVSGLWGMTNRKAEAELVSKGDRILFWLGGVGFVGEAEALEKVRELSGYDWKPYDPRDFNWGFKIKFLREFETPLHYRFPGGVNSVIGIKSSDFQFKAFFPIEKHQYDKIIKGEGLETLTPETKKEINKAIQNHQVRTIVGEVINYEGLIFGPTNEQGVIFLFSKLQNYLGISIESVQTGFPDARGRVRTDKGWKEVWIEFEYKSSSYLQHGHSLEKGDCDYIICWEDDWRNPPSHFKIIELKSELERITKGSASKLFSLIFF